MRDFGDNVCVDNSAKWRESYIPSKGTKYAWITTLIHSALGKTA
jgi:hypothetical protein